MRVAAGSADPAARSIAQIFWRADMPYNPRLRRLRSRNKVKSALTARKNGIFYWKGPGQRKR